MLGYLYSTLVDIYQNKLQYEASFTAKEKMEEQSVPQNVPCTFFKKSNRKGVGLSRRKRQKESSSDDDGRYSRLVFIFDLCVFCEDESDEESCVVRKQRTKKHMLLAGVS